MLFYSYFKTLVGKQVGSRGLMLSARKRRGTHWRHICRVASPAAAEAQSSAGTGGLRTRDTPPAPNMMILAVPALRIGTPAGANVLMIADGDWLLSGLSAARATALDPCDRDVSQRDRTACTVSGLEWQSQGAVVGAGRALQALCRPHLAACHDACTPWRCGLRSRHLGALASLDWLSLSRSN